MRVLLVEDDELLGDGLAVGLRQRQCTVDWVKDGFQAEEALKYDYFDVMVIDLGLPRKTGMQVIETLRRREDTLPILILTARETTEDKIIGLDAGADDYMVKPCDLDELAARIRALHRRKIGNTSTILREGILSIEPRMHTVTYNEEVLNFPRREYVIIEKLLENAGKVVSREQLIQSVYGWDEVDSNSLEVHMHNIRKKLPEIMIKTVRGIGYMLVKKKENMNDKTN
jgi:two-component system response regulator QseB